MVFLNNVLPRRPRRYKRLGQKRRYKRSLRCAKDPVCQGRLWPNRRTSPLATTCAKWLPHILMVALWNVHGPHCHLQIVACGLKIADSQPKQGLRTLTIAGFFCFFYKIKIKQQKKLRPKFPKNLVLSGGPLKKNPAPSAPKRLLIRRGERENMWGNPKNKFHQVFREISPVTDSTPVKSLCRGG